MTDHDTLAALAAEGKISRRELRARAAAPVAA
jgi:hypothetical protein